jgi:hypothetical protein
MKGTLDELRQFAKKEFEKLPFLVRGELFEMTPEVLASKEVETNYCLYSKSRPPRVMAVKVPKVVELAPVVEVPRASSVDVASVKVLQDATVAMEKVLEEAKKVSPVSQVAGPDQFVRVAIGGGQYDKVQTGIDGPKIVYQFHNPLKPDGKVGENMKGITSTTFQVVERFHADKNVPMTRDAGIIVTEFNPMR